MRHEDRGDPGLALYPPDLLPCLQPQPRIEVGKRLVQKQDVGKFNYGSGDGDTLLLPAGHLAGLAVQQVVYLDQFRGHLHTLLHLLLGEPVLALEVLEGEHDVLPDGHVGIESIVLEHQAYASVLGRQFGDIVVAEIDAAFRRRLQAADEVQGSALTAA